jgi:hypothetical protein
MRFEKLHWWKPDIVLVGSLLVQYLYSFRKESLQQVGFAKMLNFEVDKLHGDSYACAHGFSDMLLRLLASD